MLVLNKFGAILLLLGIQMCYNKVFNKCNKNEITDVFNSDEKPVTRNGTKYEVIPSVGANSPISSVKNNGSQILNIPQHPLDTGAIIIPLYILENDLKFMSKPTANIQKEISKKHQEINSGKVRKYNMKSKADYNDHDRFRFMWHDNYNKTSNLDKNQYFNSDLENFLRSLQSIGYGKQDQIKTLNSTTPHHQNNEPTTSEETRDVKNNTEKINFKSNELITIIDISTNSTSKLNTVTTTETIRDYINSLPSSVLPHIEEKLNPEPLPTPKAVDNFRRNKLEKSEDLEDDTIDLSINIPIRIVRKSFLIRPNGTSNIFKSTQVNNNTKIFRNQIKMIIFRFPWIISIMSTNKTENNVQSIKHDNLTLNNEDNNEINSANKRISNSQKKFSGLDGNNNLLKLYNSTQGELLETTTTLYLNRLFMDKKWKLDKNSEILKLLENLANSVRYNKKFTK